MSDLHEELLHKYPAMFDHDEHLPFSGVGPGWRDIMLRLCDRIIFVDPTIRCVQYKEKFGGLRFYPDRYEPRVKMAIDAAELESFLTCEECGEHGWTDGSSWVKTLCEQHHKERESRMPSMAST